MNVIKSLNILLARKIIPALKCGGNYVCDCNVRLNTETKAGQKRLRRIFKLLNIYLIAIILLIRPEWKYITFDWGENLIRLDFRRFDMETGRWLLDGDTDDGGKKYFSMTGSESGSPASIPEPDLALPGIYFDRVIHHA